MVTEKQKQNNKETMNTLKANLEKQGLKYKGVKDGFNYYSDERKPKQIVSGDMHCN